MEKEGKIEIFESYEPRKAVLKMSLPIVFGMLIQILYSMVDIYFIGKLNDPNQMAAANISMPIFMITMALASIVGVGASSELARALGKKKEEKTEKILGTALVLSFIIGLVYSILVLVFKDKIALLLGANNQVTQAYTSDYISILGLGSLAVIFNYVMGQMLRSESDVKTSVIGMSLGIVANIILDPIFILKLNMEVRGAAIATILGNLLSFIYYLLKYLRKKTYVGLEKDYVKLDKEISIDILKIGIPASLNQLLISVAMTISNNIAKGYGVSTLAAMGIVSKIMSIGTFIYIGFAAGSQPMVGYNFGAENMKRLRAILRTTYRIVFLIGLVLFASFQIFASQIVGFLIKDPEVIEIGSFILRRVSLSLLVVGSQMVSASAIQAMGKAKASLFLSVARQGILFIPLIYILNASLGFNGFVFAQPLADGIMIFITLTVLLKILNKTERELAS